MRRSLRRLSLGRTTGDKGNSTSASTLSSTTTSDGGSSNEDGFASPSTNRKTLKEKFDGEKILSSPGFTDRTEASLSSSMCLSETGQLVVTARRIPNSPRSPRSKSPIVIDRNSITNISSSKSLLNPIRSSTASSEAIKSPMEPVHETKPRSERRRRSSFFGSSSSKDIVKRPDYDDDADVPMTPARSTSKPKSERTQRRSMFGSNTPTNNTKDTISRDHHSARERKLPPHLPLDRHNFDGSERGGVRSTITANAVDGRYEPSTPVADGDKPKSSRRRGGLFGLAVPFSPSKKPSTSEDHQIQSSKKNEEEIILVSQTPSKPRSSRRPSSLLGTFGNGSNSSMMNGSISSMMNGSNSSIMNGSSRSFKRSDVVAPPESPMSATRKPSSSRRRHSLFGGSSSPPPSPSPTKPKSRKTSSDDRHELSLREGRSISPYDLINMERTTYSHQHNKKHSKRSRRKNLKQLTRNAELCTLARDVSRTLATSNGATCQATDYYGNVGKGTDIFTIHSQMMANNGTERSLILNTEFSEVGIGLTRNAKDGHLYMCQLFK
mmetsp:Transcript_57541/g.140534  ORF Transcript_57541/g.140534 Transcript_57541/m.140534 type:complete len:551 (-) Transcript_57541:197-1849(-)|eukprot:CAMPEP_0113456678 /NCGR_PEP_ID=MMETSP0014_2-20120614/9012_1 /TAXON_ID=2857 /ORGANISM="Nitzschia sp." /LENGTH=550 /DNA_ID=CAMNT_0000348141 /DNA_START=101 /DNA_END=1753 /DNA_ORIENTATION=- /assembly_acc=CAM_ASM_000159